MYIPPAFVQHDRPAILAFVRQFSFATLITGNGPTTSISHVPLLLDESTNEQPALVGHLARENPHAQLLDGRETTAIFHGPHAYISPTWYQEPNTVPTWNYAVVHARGRARVTTDLAQSLSVLGAYVDFYEASQPVPWQFDAESEFARRLAAQVVSFRLEVESWEAKWKLGQNHSPARRARTVAGLLAAGDPSSVAIAELMRQTLAAKS